jgi:hypothetical protein
MIWSCMLLEDVMEVFCSLMLKTFVDQFYFIFGREQYTRTLDKTHMLLFKGFELCILCMLKGTLWDRKPNIIH